MNTQEVSHELVDWIYDTVKQAGCNGVVLGLSGGVDSAVVAAASKKAFPDNVLGIIMPCYSNEEDEKDAVLLAEALDIKYKKVVLDKVYDAFLAETDINGAPRMALANIKPRLRMLTLYYHAANYNYLVAGTGNKSELTVGYFTKYGDSGADILPLASFVKHEVWDLAKYFDIPEKIINKPPSAGLWENQTDENEMGINYDELDTYILTGKADDRVKTIVDDLNRKSKHKREFAKIFVPNK